MDKQTEKKLDNNKKLQELIDSNEWKQDNMGLLVRKAIRLGMDSGATEGEMYEYLEIT